MKDPIIQTGSPVLRHIAKPVLKKEFGARKLHTLILKMNRVLDNEEFGVAIAAPQVGVSSRLFVVAGKAFDTNKKDTEVESGESGATSSMVFINPEILRLSRKKKEMSEGCLSVRGKYGTVIRHERATVRAQDAEGKTFTYHATGLVAQIFQHECDHLDGILYTDKAEHLRAEKKKENGDEDN